MARKLKIGLYGVGTDSFWTAHPGLRERFEGYLEYISKRLSRWGVKTVNVGLIDNPDKARKAGDFFYSEHVEAVFLYLSAFVLAHTVLPVAQRVPAPVMVLNLQPSVSLDYEHLESLAETQSIEGELIAHGQVSSVAAVAYVLNSAAVQYQIISGWLEDPDVWAELDSWLKALQVRSLLRDTRFGILGQYRSGMLDSFADFTRASGDFGIHFELLEVDQLHKYRRQLGEEEIRKKLHQFRQRFSVSQACSDQQLYQSARISCVLDRLILEHRLGAVACRWDVLSEQPGSSSFTGADPRSVLLVHRGIPVVSGDEVKTAIAVKILHQLGAGGSSAQFFAMDFLDDVLLLVHDGPVSSCSSTAVISLLPESIDRQQKDELMVESAVDAGAVTLLSYVQSPRDDSILLVAEGEVVEGQKLPPGLVCGRYKFPLPVKEFISEWADAGPSGYAAVGRGHWGDTVEKLSSLLGIASRRVC